MRVPADGSGPADADVLEPWLRRLATGSAFGALLGEPRESQLERGYGHTLREIAQQPLTWPKTAAAMAAAADRIRAALDRGGIPDSSGDVVLTGSGSSCFAGECAAVPLQEFLGVVVRALPAGLILTHPRGALAASGRGLVVSLARSGDSPESAAVVERLLGQERVSQLLISCNRDGALDRRFGTLPGVASIVLPEETNDRSLMMTSSFTNLVLAARSIADPGERSLESASRLAEAGRLLLETHAGQVATLARRSYPQVVYLASGGRLGAARESALKMLESNGGAVGTLAESFLGLRHGPMAALRADSLVVAFLSSDPVVRAYETDVLVEIRRKGLGRRRLVVGERIPAELVSGSEDVPVDLAGAGRSLVDGELVVLDAVVGQLLAFFRCLHGGGRPDSPSSGVIHRVVESFAIHADR